MSENEKRSKLPVIAGVAIGAVVAIILLFAVYALLTSEPIAKNSSTLSAKSDAAGNTFIATMDGELIQIPDSNVKSAILSPDRKRIAVRLSDSTLYTMDKNFKNQKILSTQCRNITAFRNDGIMYELYNSDYVIEANGKLVLNEVDARKVAANSLTVLYARLGDIQLFTSDGFKMVTIGSYDEEEEEVKLCAVSDDGSVAVWSVSNGNRHTVMLYENGETINMGSFTDDYNLIEAILSKDGQIVVVKGVVDENIWFKVRGKNFVKLKLGGYTNTSEIFTDNGLLEEEVGTDISGIYFGANNKNFEDVIYFLDTAGNLKEAVKGGVEDFTISKGKVAYIDENKNLYCGDITAGAASVGELLATDVYTMDFAYGMPYVYYLTNCADGEGDLYAFKMGESAPVFVDASVAYSGQFYMCAKAFYVRPSLDGSEILYSKYVEELKDDKGKHKTLMRYTFGSSAPKRITSGVMQYSEEDGITSNSFFNTERFTFLQYEGYDSDDVRVKWMYCDGEKITELKSNILE